MGRSATVERETSETRVRVSLDLDGVGLGRIATGIAFFDHMLTQIARHGLIDLEVSAQGDLEVDGHHTVEDVGIALGQALRRALGDGRGIRRYGEARLPMDEALAWCALDISGRPLLVCRASFPAARLGAFDAELVPEFFRAVATHGGLTLHLGLEYGSNSHHMVEGLFKAFARALRQAVGQDRRVTGIPSSKGSLL